MTELAFAETNNYFIKEKIFSAGFALLICFAFVPLEVLDVYIILGHAHFMLSHLYLAKAGKATRKNVFLFLVSLISLFVVAFQWPNAFTLFVASFLVLHVYISEIKILNIRLNFWYLSLMLAIMMLNGAWLTNAFWQIDLRPDLMSYFFLSAGSVVFAWYLFRRKTIEINAFFIFLSLILLAYIGLELSGNPPSPYKTYGFIVITHYMTFYVLYIRNFYKVGSEKLKTFVNEIFILNIVIIFGYIIVTMFLGQDNLLYKFWYMPISFYVWTLMHFLTTLRKSDYAGAFRIP